MGQNASGAGRYRGALLLLLLLLSALNFGVSAWRSRASGFVDLPIFLRQAERFLETGELYRPPDDPQTYAPAAAVYKFPPLFAISLLPLVRDGAQFSDLIVHWYGQLALYAIAVALLLQPLMRGRDPTARSCALLLALNFVPFFETLWRLQVETPLLLLIVLALALHRSERDLGAGACLGVAAMLKLYPAFLLLYFVAGRRWRALAGAALAGLLVMVASVVIIGVEQNLTYFLRVLPVLGAETPQWTPENVSPARYLVGLGLGGEAAKRLGQLLALALAGWTGYRVHRLPGDAPPSTRLLLASAFIPIMLLAMPNSWVNYQLLLLVPLCLAVGALVVEGRAPDRPALALLAVAYGVMLFYAPCAPPVQDWPCAQTPHFLGAFVLPRGLHDSMVDLRGLAPLLIWLASVRLGRDAQARGIEASR